MRLLLLPLIALPAAAAEEWSALDLEFFEREVRPVLAERCYKCHSAGAEKLKAGLYLDSREGLLEGGDSGPAIVVGKPDESRLIESVRYKNVDFQMPPKSRLSGEEVSALEKWVTLGAPWPKEDARSAGARKKSFDLEGRRKEHWCWQPVQAVQPPAVRDKAWPRNSVDHFILARLEGHDLPPAKDADRRTFIRRVTFDLVGLPPTPEEVEAFLSDDSDDAVEKLVDRLLASPHFGEKWARHWMDLVRYGESYGHEFDYTVPHAPGYRDYLIRAWNADVPYDRFLTEHIAGDLVPDPRRHPEEDYNEAVLGTGFWWLGEAVHAPTDIRGDEADRIDNQIDVLTRGFLGLTVACARCHDHKFDAISTADYYAMAGFLQGTRREHSMLDPGRRIEKGAAALRTVQEEATRALQEKFPAAAVAPGGREVIADFDAGLPAGWTTGGEAFADAVTPIDRPVVSLGAGGVAAAGVIDSGLHGAKLQGELRSPTFTLGQPKIYVLMKSTGPVQVRVVVDGHFMHEFHTLLVKGTILKDKGADTKGKWEWKQLAADLVKYVGHEVYLEFSDLGDGSIAVDEISYERPGGHDAPPGFELGDAAGDLLAPFMERAAKIEKGIPAPRRALGTADGSAENERVHIRGSHMNLGEEVPRRFLEALGGEQVPANEPGSGRLQLAAQVASPENPLTARVLVNRLWHHLTGRGIVPTVDDFGVMGMEPSHPQLLDWLAREFTANGWSMKRAIRQIVMSRTYAMSCTPEAAPGRVAQHDADNVLLHKFRVRRLPAESIRDGVLATSGRLDRRMFGGSVPVHLTSFMEGRGRPKAGPLDGRGRRSVYIAIRRNFLPDFQMAFDMPSPFSTMGRRSVSNVPAQALVMMNDPFVIEQAGVWAKRLCGEQAEADERIERAYREAFSRPPAAEEVEAAREFLSAQAGLHGGSPDDPKVWADFCHVLFNQKEYIFLR